MAFRFVHAADIHLDSPLLSLEEYPGAPLAEIRLATRRALAKLVDFAIESEATFVIVAGDLFDGEWRDCNTGLYFVSEMKRLKNARDSRLYHAWQPRCRQSHDQHATLGRQRPFLRSSQTGTGACSRL